jgi:hypothetical protein
MILFQPTGEYVMGGLLENKAHILALNGLKSI